MSFHLVCRPPAHTCARISRGPHRGSPHLNEPCARASAHGLHPDWRTVRRHHTAASKIVLAPIDEAKILIEPDAPGWRQPLLSLCPNCLLGSNAAGTICGVLIRFHEFRIEGSGRVKQRSKQFQIQLVQIIQGDVVRKVVDLPAHILKRTHPIPVCNHSVEPHAYTANGAPGEVQILFFEGADLARAVPHPSSAPANDPTVAATNQDQQGKSLPEESAMRRAGLLGALSPCSFEIAAPEYQGSRGVKQRMRVGESVDDSHSDTLWGRHLSGELQAL